MAVLEARRPGSSAGYVAPPEDQLMAALAEEYLRVGRDILEPLLDVLGATRTMGCGDIDKFMIMLVVALRTAAHPEVRERGAEAYLDTDELIPTLGINARSLSDTLGVPRETVRRKVSQLVEDGCLLRVGHNLHYTDHAYRQMAPIRERIRRLAVCCHDVVAKLALERGLAS